MIKDFERVKQIVALDSLGSSSSIKNISDLEVKIIWNLKFNELYETDFFEFSLDEQKYLLSSNSEEDGLPKFIHVINRVMGSHYLVSAYRWLNMGSLPFDCYLVNFIRYFCRRNNFEVKLSDSFLKYASEACELEVAGTKIKLNKLILSLFFLEPRIGQEYCEKRDIWSIYKLLGLFLRHDFNFIQNFKYPEDLLLKWSTTFLPGEDLSLLDYAIYFSDEKLQRSFNLRNRVDCLNYRNQISNKYEQFGLLPNVPQDPNLENTAIALTGWVKTEVGIGEDVRTAARSFKSVGVNFVIKDAADVIPPSPAQVDLGFDKLISKSNREDIEIVFLDAATQFKYFSKLKFKNRSRDSIKVVVCPWELPKWPSEASFVFDDVDYFWAATNYIKNAFLDRFPKNKVVLAPPAVYINEEYKKPFDVRQVKGPFRFLTVFDGLSSIARKNPLATIKAFQRAFSEGENVKLVVKTMNFNSGSQELEELKKLILSDNRIELINEKLSTKELFALLNSSHAFVSLHRSEGFGRNIAEAMLLKRPVVVSAYSGNLDFCFDDNAYLVKGELVPVNPGEYWFSDGQKWFEASTEEAAKHMHDIYTDRRKAFQKAENAYEYISEFHSIKSAGKRYKNIIRSL